MRLCVALMCFLAGCLAQKPQPCSSPALMSGAYTVNTQNEMLWVYSTYEYDALEQRTRCKQYGTYQSKPFTQDLLRLFKEGVVYQINEANRTCVKFPLKDTFHPMGIPKDASLLSQSIIGSSSAPGQGLLVNTWTGDLPEKQGKYIKTVTEFGCIYVNVLFQTKEYGWVVTNAFNNVIGLSDPSLLNPPDFCADAVMNTNEEPQNFLSLLHSLP